MAWFCRCVRYKVARALDENVRILGRQPGICLWYMEKRKRYPHFGPLSRATKNITKELSESSLHPTPSTACPCGGSKRFRSIWALNRWEEHQEMLAARNVCRDTLNGFIDRSCKISQVPAMAIQLWHTKVVIPNEERLCLEDFCWYAWILQSPDSIAKDLGWCVRVYDELLRQKLSQGLLQDLKVKRTESVLKRNASGEKTTKDKRRRDFLQMSC